MNHKNFIIQPLIRKEILFSKNKFKKKTKNLSLLIIGGSQSAKKFDNLFKEDLIELSKKIKIKIFHQTSKENLKKLKQFYLSKNINFEVFYYANNLHKIIVILFLITFYQFSFDWRSDDFPISLYSLTDLH